MVLGDNSSSGWCLFYAGIVLTILQSLTLTDAETLVLKTLKQVMEEKLDSKNVQLASVTKEKGFRIYTDEEMATVVERLPAN